ncbi:MAG: hypothetical protein R2705_02430 [Ilumatobacteraceae bacterium]
MRGQIRIRLGPRPGRPRRPILTFSDAEKSLIQYTWMRMAEDYAPFDVDVTTEEPAPEAIDRTDASDDEFGTRVVITPSTGIKSVCGCGGIAYVGAFDSTTNHAALQPAFVFIADNAKNIAGGLARGRAQPGAEPRRPEDEPGHRLLQRACRLGPHHGRWLLQEVTQFSKGEYTKANNKEDDFAVIQSNGLRLLDDGPAARPRMRPSSAATSRSNRSASSPTARTWTSIASTPGADR